MRSQSKVSDTSEALPDLELEDDVPPVLFSSREGSKPVNRKEERELKKAGDQEDFKPSAEVLDKKEQALKDASDNKQKIKEVKGIYLYIAV